VSRKPPIEQLKDRIGEKISQFFVEHWIADGNQNTPIISVSLVFDEGQSFILGCAGDGSVFVRKGQPAPIPNETELRSHQAIVGSTLNSVTVEETEIEFTTSSGSLVVANVCDEIEIRQRAGDQDRAIAP
jgi:hypothetical protein